jgi:xanthine dehydrogenase accessory factor
MSSAMKDIYDIIGEFKKRCGEQFALATLVRATGSSYRRPGAHMLICEDGATIGSLSGGCLEEEVALRARDVVKTGELALMSFDTRKRFGCNGKIEIFIERVAESFFVELAQHLDVRRGCVAVTTFEGDSDVLGSRVLKSSLEGGAPATPSIVRSRGSSTLHLPDGVFARQIHPPIQLLICGDGPDSTPLRLLAELLGWIPIEIPDVNSLTIQPDDWTAAIVKSHNYGRDFSALQRLLPLNLPYVGLIGPRKRRDQLLNDLLDVGVAINAGFFAPAGIDLGAESPEEIALAIVSEIQRVFAGGTGESLRERKSSIHVPKESNQRNSSTSPHFNPLALIRGEG